MLLDKEDGLMREEYEEYDEKDEDKGDWTFRDDVFVYAVNPNRENYLVEVKVPPSIKRKL